MVYDAGQKWDEKRQEWVRHQKWEAAGTKRKDADRILASRLNEVHRGEFRESRKTYFAEVAEEWYGSCVKGEDLKPSTQDFYRRNLDLHILPVFDGKRLHDVRLDDLQAFVAAKREDGKAASTVNGLITTLTAIFKYAVRSNRLRRNPAQYIRRPKKRHREMDFLTPEEVRIFLGHVTSSSYPLYLMALTAGLRRGELLAAKWGNVDWENGQYFVRETLAMPRIKEGPLFVEPKSTESRKPVDLTPKMLEALRHHRAEQAEEKLALGRAYAAHDLEDMDKQERAEVEKEVGSGEAYLDLDLIFCQSNGKPIDSSNLVRRDFRTTLKKADLRTIRFHDLRHTCASLLIA